MQSHTKKSTRIIIWVIAITMAVGFIGSSYLIILENNAANRQTTTPADQTPAGQADPSAYKVDGAVTALGITDLKVGTGEAAKAGSYITVHYKGTLAQSGVKFDSSYDRGEPITLKLQVPTETESGVILGWVMGIDGMQVGGKRRLIIPANLAYAESGSGSIPPNADLVFEVELLSVTPPSDI